MANLYVGIDVVEHVVGKEHCKVPQQNQASCFGLNTASLSGAVVLSISSHYRQQRCVFTGHC